MGLLPVQIVVVAKDSRETETITLNKDLEKALNLPYDYERVDEETADRISMMLMLKTSTTYLVQPTMSWPHFARKCLATTV